MDPVASGGNKFPTIRNALAGVRRQLVYSLSKYLMSPYLMPVMGRWEQKVNETDKAPESGCF